MKPSDTELSCFDVNKSGKPFDHKALSIFVPFFYLAGFIIYYLQTESGVSILTKTWTANIWALFWIAYYYFARYGKDFNYSAKLITVIGFCFMYIIPTFFISYYYDMDDYMYTEFHNAGLHYGLASLLAGISIIIMLFGYDFLDNYRNSMPIKLPLIDHFDFSPPVILVFISTTYAMSWAARIYNLSIGIYYHVFLERAFLTNKYFSILQNIENMRLITVFYVWYRFFSKKSTIITPLIILGIEMAWYLPSGSRLKILLLFFVILFAYWVAKRRFSVKLFMIIFAIMVSVFPIMYQYRTTISGTGISMDDFKYEDAKAAYLEAVFWFEDSGKGGGTRKYIKNFNDRVYDGLYFAYILENYRKAYDFEYGMTVVSRLPNIFVPNFIYKHEKIIQLPLNAYPLLYDSYWRSCPATFLGEAYINFGYLGFLIMPFLLGIIIGFVDLIYKNFADGKHNNTLPLIIYAYVTTTFLCGASYPMSVWLAFLRNYIIYIYVVYICCCLLDSLLKKNRAGNP